MEKLLTLPPSSPNPSSQTGNRLHVGPDGKLPHLRLGRLVRFTFEHLKKFTEGNGDGGSSEGGNHAAKL
jgi:hypothetical protein